MLQRIGRIKDRMAWKHLFAVQADHILDEGAVGRHGPQEPLPIRQGRLCQVTRYLEPRSIADPDQFVDTSQGASSSPAQVASRVPTP